METVKKIKNRAGRPRRIDVRTAAGNVSDEVRRARTNDPVWDVQWYNFQTEEWDRDGQRLTYRQAYNRATYLRHKYPYCKIGVLLITGRRPKINGTSSPKVEVGADK